MSPWLTKGLVKSSNKKHKLYNKYLKHKTYKNECNYKTYKQLFETLKKQSNKVYYAKQLKNCRSNIKETWKITKEVIGKTSLKTNNLPNKIVVSDKEIYNKKLIATSFNNYFVNVGPNLANKIPNSERRFESYIDT